MQERPEFQSLTDEGAEVITNMPAIPTSLNHDSDGLQDCTSSYGRMGLLLCPFMYFSKASYKNHKIFLL